MKTSVIITVTMLLINSFSAPSQPGLNTKPSVADSLKEAGNIPAAIHAYKILYSKNPQDYRNTYNYACALSINRQIDSSYKYLTLAVNQDATISPLIDPDFLSLRRDQRWQEFEDIVIEMLNLKLNNAIKDKEYAKALWKMRAYDQALFTEVGIAGRNLGFKSSVVEALWLSKSIIQENSQKELDELIELKGWPRVKDVGSEAAMAAYLTIMHSDAKLQKKYIPSIKKICEDNELPWFRYANIYDRCCVNENKPQRYGTHTIYNETSQTQELYPLEDDSKVDLWRKEVGLQPLAEYLAQFSITYEPKK